MSLIEAVKENNIKLVKNLLFFLHASANIDLKDKHGWTVLMEASCLGHIECVQLLLQAGANPNIQSKHCRETALMKALWKGHTECVNVLLNAGANIHIQDIDGMTALIWASLHGRIECVNALLIAGANVNLQDYYGYTALMRAKKYKHKKIIKILKRMVIVQLLINL